MAEMVDKSGDVMVIDSSHLEVSQILSGDGVKKQGRKSNKRKRAFLDGEGVRDKEGLLTRCREELEELFQFFKDALVPRLGVESVANPSNDALVACLMEGSSLSLPKLAEEIYEKVEGKEGITVATLLRDVPFVGSRIKYGIDDGNLNLGEDESESCLWCWEAREMSMLPKVHRGVLKCMRMGRKKVHARAVALSATIAVLSKSDQIEKSDLLKASEKLGQELNIAEIRSFVEREMQKKNANTTEKESKLKEKEALKEIEKSKRNAEKEMKRKESELQKEKARNEKELKRLKEEAEKEERRREKEESEKRKQLKRQQDEADKEQKRREKQEAEHKKKLTMQKQATMMERFLKIKKNNPQEEDKKSPEKDLLAESSNKNDNVVATVTSSMDIAFSFPENHITDDLYQSHLAGWKRLRNVNRYQHWGVRHKPKAEVVKELKLHGGSSGPGSSEKNLSSSKVKEPRCLVSGNDMNVDKIDDEIDEIFVDDLAGSNVVDKNISNGTKLPKHTRKLLQFDKNHRPAYYGSWSKQSGAVGPRCPLAKDPDLDYDVDSDEEWEEEEPGESLTDCEKDEDEESEEPKADIDDESEDSFFVPDGYLSENEGVEADATSSAVVVDEVQTSPNCLLRSEDQVFRSLLQLQKNVCSLTEKALRKCKPLFISNLMHEKAGLLEAENLDGVDKIEQLCLRALSMQPYPGGCVVDLSFDAHPQENDEETCLSQPSGASTGVSGGAILNSDLPEFVKSIQTNSVGITKVIESIQQKFPTLSKSSIKNKVKEIADFVDNHWQVKKEVLNKLGIFVTPVKTRKTKGIATFFSKRCLPPTSDAISGSDLSPPLQKTKTRINPDVAVSCPVNVVKVDDSPRPLLASKNTP